MKEKVNHKIEEAIKENVKFCPLCTFLSCEPLHQSSAFITFSSARSKLTHEGERMSTEIPIWVNGKIRWLAGIDKKTTCKDVVEVLLEGEGMDKSEVKDFTIVERWRKVERPLDENSRILRIWSHWGNEKKEVRLCLRRIDNEVDSGRGSPIGSGNTPSLRRKRNRSRGNGKPPWIHQETLHPRRLAELGRFDKNDCNLRKGKINLDCNPLTESYETNNNNYCNYDEIYDVENVNKKSGHKSYHCSGTGRLHSTLLSDYSNPENNYSKPRSKCCSKRESKQKVRNSENIEKLMKLILAQGATIQNQLQKLKEREEQIESIEHERHRERIEKNGRNYLLETYLGSLKDAEIPVEVDEEKGNDSGVHTEGGSDQTNPVKKENTERLQQNETEFDRSGKGKGKPRQGRGGGSDDVSNQSANQTVAKSHQKSTRSKSESRTQECKLEGSLKRTLSDNAIAESGGGVIGDEDEKEIGEVDVEPDANAKEESEVVELRRIQSQIEMWEKVFRINKKLEKEEENLVRLHIKIKKIQSENYRIAKERFEENAEEAETSNESPEARIEIDQVDYEQERLEMQKDLETLRSDLEQNSKEIYENFTTLIEGDEVVEQKRSCITKLISDLERTKLEHNMLNEMIAMSEGRQSDQDVREQANGSRFDVAGDYREDASAIIPSEIPSVGNDGMCSNALVLSQKLQDHQRTESEVGEERTEAVKPKIVKISFDDAVQNCESVPNGQERFSKEPATGPVPSGALKGILKNRKNSYIKNLEKSNGEQQQQQQQSNETNQQNFNNSNYVHINYPYPSDLPDRINYSIPSINHFSHENNQNYYGQPGKFPEKTVYPLKSPHCPGIPKPPTNVFPHSTMVTTKALVHNDTDSSTSSDTSGLSSMYSSSPTVEEPYVEQSYVLDTLV